MFPADYHIATIRIMPMSFEVGALIFKLYVYSFPTFPDKSPAYAVRKSRLDFLYMPWQPWISLLGGHSVHVCASQVKTKANHASRQLSRGSLVPSQGQVNSVLIMDDTLLFFKTGYDVPFFI